MDTRIETSRSYVGLHVACSSRKRNCLTTSRRSTSINAALYAVVCVHHFHVASALVHTALNHESCAIRIGVRRHVAAGARDSSSHGIGVVDTQSVSGTTELGGVTRARGDAVAKNTGDRRAVRRQRVAAVAFAGVLKSSIVEPTTFTIAQTRLHRHRRGGEAATVEGASGAISAAAYVVPPSDIGGVGHGSSNCSNRAVGVASWSRTRTWCDWVTSRESVQDTSHRLVNTGGNDACFTLSCREEIKHITVRK